MAQPIPLEIPPRNPRAELRSRLEQGAPQEHAEAVLPRTKCCRVCTIAVCWKLCAVPLAASDEILEKVVDNVKTPEAIRASGNLAVLAADSGQH